MPTTGSRSMPSSPDSSGFVSGAAQGAREALPDTTGAGWLALAAVVTYLVVVLIAGNGQRLLDELARDKGFIPWAGAAALVWYVSHRPELRGLSAPLWGLTIGATAFGIVRMRQQSGSKFELPSIADILNRFRG